MGWRVVQWADNSALEFLKDGSPSNIQFLPGIGKGSSLHGFPARLPSVGQTKWYTNFRTKAMSFSEYIKDASRISVYDLEDFYEAFVQFDKDGSGTISTKELGHLIRALGENPTEQQLQEITQEADMDGSGEMEFVEFCVIMKRLMKDSDSDIIRQAFRTFDRDGNGVISTEEFKYSMRNMGVHMSEVEVEEMMKTMDVDQNGEIDYEEFVQMMSLDQPVPIEVLEEAKEIIESTSKGDSSRSLTQQTMNAKH